MSLFGLMLSARFVNRGHGERAATMAVASIATATLLQTFVLLGGAPGTPSYLILGVASLVGSASLFTVLPVMQARIAERVPDGTAFALTLNGSAGSLGQGVDAALGGLLLSAAGAFGNFAGSFVLTLAAFAIWHLACRAPNPSGASAKIAETAAGP